MAKSVLSLISELAWKWIPDGWSSDRELTYCVNVLRVWLVNQLVTNPVTYCKFPFEFGSTFDSVTIVSFEKN